MAAGRVAQKGNYCVEKSLDTLRLHQNSLSWMREKSWVGYDLSTWESLRCNSGQVNVCAVRWEEPLHSWRVGNLASLGKGLVFLETSSRTWVNSPRLFRKKQMLCKPFLFAMHLQSLNWNDMPSSEHYVRDGTGGSWVDGDGETYETCRKCVTYEGQLKRFFRLKGGVKSHFQKHGFL